MELDPLSDRILAYLADQYRPVSSEWVETAAVAQALGVERGEVNARCMLLVGQGLIELSPPDDENEGYAAIITNRGLLSIGRVP